MTYRRIIVIGLKIIFACGLLCWLYGKYEIKGLTVAFSHPFSLGLAFLALGVADVAAAFRWHFILRAFQIAIPRTQALSLTFIGLFFSTVLPGGVTGDAVKVYYVSKSYQGSLVRASTSVFLDRLFGISVAVIMAIIALTIFSPEILANPTMRPIVAFLVGYVVILALSFQAFRTKRIRSALWSIAAKNQIPGLERLLSSFQEIFFSARGHRKYLPISLLLAVISMLSTSAVFFFIGQALEVGELSLATCILITPIILIVFALPIAPAGVGVGQAAALFLFGSLRGMDSVAGVNVITAYQVLLLGIASLGAATYIGERVRTREIFSAVQERAYEKNGAVVLDDPLDVREA